MENEPDTPSDSDPGDAKSPTSPPRSLAQRLWSGFWLAALVIGLAWLWHILYVPSNAIAWAGSFDTAQHQAAETGKPMILFFTGPWCVPCRVMKRQVWADSQVEARVNAEYIPVLLDVSDTSAAATVQRYEVWGTPTTIITDARGEALDRAVGGLGQAEFLAWLDQVGARSE